MKNYKICTLKKNTKTAMKKISQNNLMNNKKNMKIIRFAT